MRAFYITQDDTVPVHATLNIHLNVKKATHARRYANKPLSLHETLYNHFLATLCNLELNDSDLRKA